MNEIVWTSFLPSHACRYLPVSHKDGASIFLHYTDGKPSPRSKYDPFLNTPQPISMVNKMTDLYVRYVYAIIPQTISSSHASTFVHLR